VTIFEASFLSSAKKTTSNNDNATVTITIIAANGCFFSGEPELVDYAPAFSSTLSWTAFSLVTCGTGLQTRCPLTTNQQRKSTNSNHSMASSFLDSLLNSSGKRVLLFLCWIPKAHTLNQKSGSISEVFPKLNVSYMYYMQIN